MPNRLLLVLPLGICLLEAHARCADWPQFRGPDGQGHAADCDPPVSWSETEHVVWKRAIPGRGWSSPVVRGDQVWMTTSVRRGRSLRAVCIDRQTGRVVHNIEVFRAARPGRIHAKNSHASPTPVIDGDRMFVHFGAHGTACLTSQGEILWKTELAYYHHHGPAASPVRSGDLLIVVCDGFVEPFYDKVAREKIEQPQFIVGLDAASGRPRWRRRREGRHAYCTPLVIHAAGRTQLIAPGGDRVTAYDPQTGDEIWWCRYAGYSVTPRPVYGSGLVVVCTGYDEPSVLAIRPDGTGDVTGTHIAWQSKRGSPLSPSPLIVDDELYLVSDAGIATCLDLASADVRWRERLGGDYSASPVYAGGRIYLFSENGTAHVIEASAKFNKLSVNRLSGRTLASAAVAGRSLFVRTEKHLYRIDEP